MNFLIQAVVNLFVAILIIPIIGIVLYKIRRLKKKKKLAKIDDVKRVVIDVDKIVEDRQKNKFGITTFSSSSKETLTFIKFKEALKTIQKDSKITEIILDIDKFVLSKNHVEELEPIFGRLRETKKVIAYGTDIYEDNYMTGLLANEIYLFNSKQAGIRFTGQYYSKPYLKLFLQKFGIKMNVIHIGEFKTAFENFNHSKMSESSRQDIMHRLDEDFKFFTNFVKERRGLDIGEEILNGEWIKLNPYESQEKGATDGTFRMIDKKYDYKKDALTIKKYLEESKSSNKDKKENKIGVIFLEGTIDSSSKGDNYISSSNIEKKLEKIENDDSYKGLVLRINSPGGSAIESEKIYQILKEVNIPIYISMGRVCASGGYYIASVGEKIFAGKSTITGSIGVVGAYPNLKDLIEKLDINNETISNGKFLDMYNPLEDLSDSSKSEIIRQMNEIYDEFKDHVVEARGIDREEIEKIAGGRVWTGEEALERNLIDEIGNLDDAIESLAKNHKIEDYKVDGIFNKKSLKDMLDVFKSPSLLEMEMEKIKSILQSKEHIYYVDTYLYDDFNKDIFDRF